MSRHSKNNTASSVFTNHERSQLTQYGTQKQRIGTDSIKEFDACSICIHSLIEPMCCPKGHLFCKECIYSYLLNQKKEIARVNEKYEEQQQNVKDEEERKKQEQKEKDIEKFDKTVLGILPEKSQVFKMKKDFTPSTEGQKEWEEMKKRQLNPREELKRIAKEQNKSALPSFWVVSKCFVETTAIFLYY